MNALPPLDLDEIQSLRARLYDAGYRPLPVYSTNQPVKSPGKQPVGEDWQNVARRDPPPCTEQPARREAANTGILCDGLRAIDIDVDDPDLAARLKVLALTNLGDAPIRYRRNTGRVLLLYRAAQGEPGKRTLTGADHSKQHSKRIEVLGTGQQFVAFGMHPTGVAPQWMPEPLDQIPHDALPAITEDTLTAFLAAAAPMLGAPTPGQYEGDAEHIPSALGPSADPLDIAAALAAIPNPGRDWDAWSRVGLATWAASGGSQEGFSAWSAWSARCAAEGVHDHGACRDAWHGFRRCPPTEIGAGTLFHLARDARPDWKKPTSPTTTPDIAERKRPLRREMPPPEPYPMEALLALRPAVEAIQRRTQAPQALCAASVLAATGFAASIHHDIEIPTVGARPLATAFLTIAQSGERKTSVDHLASLPIRRAEAALAAQYDAANAAYSRDKEAFEAARIEARKAAKNGRTAAERALADVGSEPTKPAPPMLTAEEGTIEGLIALLIERPYAAIFSAEGGMFLGGHAMSEDAAVRTMTTINTLWDGAPIKRLRASKATYAPGRRASLSLAVQRSVAAILLGNACARDNGLLARMLIAEPESTIGSRMWRERESDFDQFLEDYNDRLGALLARSPRRLDGSDGLDPDPLPFNIEAERLLIAFHDDTERDLAAGRRYASIRGFGAKLVEHAARLAGILAAYADRDMIDAETFDAGATLATWYAGEQLRLGETVAPDPELDAAQELLAWWQDQPEPRLYLTALYKSGPNKLRKADDAKRAVAILEDHGWIERLPAGTVLDGSPRKEAWALIP